MTLYKIIKTRSKLKRAENATETKIKTYLNFCPDLLQQKSRHFEEKSNHFLSVIIFVPFLFQVLSARHTRAIAVILSADFAIEETIFHFSFFSRGLNLNE